LFPFPSHSHLIIPIPIPTHSRSHFGPRLYIDYFRAEKYVYCVVNSKHNMKLQQKHCNQTHHSSVIIIIIITIIANHCSLFTVQRLWEFYFSPIKYAVPIPSRTIPIPISISSPTLLPFPWESHGNPIPMHISSPRASVPHTGAEIRADCMAWIDDEAVNRRALKAHSHCARQRALTHGNVR